MLDRDRREPHERDRDRDDDRDVTAATDERPRASGRPERRLDLGGAGATRLRPSRARDRRARRPAGRPRPAERPERALAAARVTRRSRPSSLAPVEHDQLPDPGQPRPGAAGAAAASGPWSAEDTARRYQITTLHPTTYSEARTIGEHFRDGVPVIMNLTEMDEADAKRLVDFAAGLAFGLRGTIERVTNRVFLLSPANVQVTAEDKAKIAEGGFFNQS